MMHLMSVFLILINEDICSFMGILSLYRTFLYYFLAFKYLNAFMPYKVYKAIFLHKVS